MPADHGLGLDDDQDSIRARPEPVQRDPGAGSKKVSLDPGRARAWTASCWRGASSTIACSRRDWKNARTQLSGSVTKLSRACTARGISREVGVEHEPDSRLRSGGSWAVARGEAGRQAQQSRSGLISRTNSALVLVVPSEHSPGRPSSGARLPTGAPSQAEQFGLQHPGSHVSSPALGNGLLVLRNNKGGCSVVHRPAPGGES
jgi:hypothetical protein